MFTHRGRWTPTKNLVHMLKLMMQHTHQESMKSCYIIDNSGEQSRLLKQALNGLSKQGKETGLSLSWVEGGSERVCAQSGACMV